MSSMKRVLFLLRLRYNKGGCTPLFRYLYICYLWVFLGGISILVLSIEIKTPSVRLRCRPSQTNINWLTRQNRFACRPLQTNIELEWIESLSSNARTYIAQLSPPSQTPWIKTLPSPYFQMTIQTSRGKRSGKSVSERASLKKKIKRKPILIVYCHQRYDISVTCAPTRKKTYK
jgi:hypothetical protein